MNTQYQGSCLCKNISYKIEGDFEQFFLCHCQYCQKDTGSAHAANLFSTKAQLKWIQGEHLLKHYQLTNTRHIKCFCSQCGSALPYFTREEEKSFLMVPAGSLDSEINLTPNAHLFISSKANWDHDLEKVVKFNKFPE